MTKTIYKFLLSLIMLMGVTSAWADSVVTLFTTNFSTTDGWSTEDIITSSTTSATKLIKGTTISFKGYKNSNLKVAVGETNSANGTLTFTGNNMTASAGAASGANYYMAIPVSGVNGELTVTTTGDATKWYYTYDDGNKGTVVNRQQASDNGGFTITGLTNSNVTIYIGNNGKELNSITITTQKKVKNQAVTGVKIGGVAVEGASFDSNNTFTSAQGSPSLPTVSITRHVVYIDDTEDDVDVNVTMTKDGEYFVGKATINEVEYTVKVPVLASNERLLTSVKFSNGFNGFITDATEQAHGSVAAYYMEGESAPTIINSSITVSEKATHSVDGNTITVTAEDGSTAIYDVTISSVSPYTGTGLTFDGTETWIKTGNAYIETNGDKTYYAWVINKQATTDNRVRAGRTRIYYFIGPSQSITLTNDRGTALSTARNIKVYVNGVEDTSVTSMPQYNETTPAAITINTGAAAMIEISSNQTSGDTGWGKIDVTKIPSSTYTITYVNNNHGTAPEAVSSATALPAELPTMTEEGWTFGGWYTDEDLTVAAVAGATISANTTLYAKWTENESGEGTSVEERTATWDFKTMAADEVNINGAKGIVASAIEGVELAVDATATSAKLVSRGSDAQFNTGAVISVPVRHAGDIVTVVSYPGYHNYTVAGTAATADTETYTATAADATAGKVDIKATDTAYLYSISVKQIAYTEGGGEEGPASYDNVEATISWTVGNETAGSVSATVADAVSSTKAKTAATLQTAVKSDYAANIGVPMVQYQPSTSKAGNVADVMVEYTVKMQKGTTFTPTSVSYDAIKVGTNDAYFSWSYTTDGTESTVKDVAAANILRNDNSNASSAQLGHSETISNATPARTVTVRFYISQCANNKQIALSNIKINGVVDGTVEQRTFQNFKIDFRTEEPTIVMPTEGLPSGVVLNKGAYKDTQHGTQNGTITVPVDGPVKFTIGGCQYTNKATVSINGGTAIDIDTKSAGCEDSGVGKYNKYATYTYNAEESATLVFNLGAFCPYFFAEACEYVPMVDVTYYDTDGRTVIGNKTVEGSSALEYAYGAEDVTVASDKKFRGWFSSASLDAVKIKEGTSVNEDLKLYAKATDIEEATVGSVWEYDLRKVNFYPEDHELIELNGRYNDSQHGWAFSTNGTAKIKVAGNAIINFGLCKFAGEGVTITVTDGEGNKVGESIGAKVETDGAKAVINYTGGATTLTLTMSGTAYIHDFKIFNIDGDLPQKNEEGYYVMNAGDGAGLLLVLANLQEGDKVFLPNGTYDFGETVLTTISANNVSIIGESMEGVIIKNAPQMENEGIGKTATIYNASNGLYLQDLTLQNALDYYGKGGDARAVCLQDEGYNTICKNVRLLSYQDTYYSHKASNYYWEDSEIHGTVDYLCGDGNVVYNRVKLVNESRSKDSESGETTICAPYNTATTDTRYNWGYVFLDCTIDTKSSKFNLGRAWGGESKATYINTTILQPEKLIANRWTLAGMNVAATAFKEYNTLNESGEVISPSTFEKTFTHSSGNKTFETILTATEAAEYTLGNIFGSWNPAEVCAPATIAEEDAPTEQNGVITFKENGTYLIETKAGEFVGIAKGTEYTLPTTESAAKGSRAASVEPTYTARKANGRGGFGEAVDVKGVTNGINSAINAANTVNAIYNIAGQKVSNNYKGITIQNGRKYYVK